MVPRTAYLRSMLLLALFGTSACEVAADFDPKKLDMDRTVGPTPLPTVDGAVPVIPEAGIAPDGALVRPEESDARVDTLDAASDANVPQDGDASDDAAARDAASDAQSADSVNDAASSDDLSFADASG